MAIAEKQQCPHRIYRSDGPFRGSLCKGKATLEHEGNWYCASHYPPNVTKRNVALREKWDAQNKARYDRIQQNIELQQARDAVIAAAEALFSDWNDEDTALGAELYDSLQDAVRALRALQQPAAPGKERT